MFSVDRYMENRIKGIIKAYLFGGVSLNWVQNSLKKNHSADDILNVLKKHAQQFQQINSTKFVELSSILGIK